MSLLVIWVLINGRYAVENKEMSDAARIGGMAHGSPDKKARMRVVANDVRVIAVLIPAAIHNVVT